MAFLAAHTCLALVSRPSIPARPPELALPKPELTKKLQLLRTAIRPSDWVRVKVALLIGEVSREQVAYARIYVHDAKATAGFYAITETAHAAERGQVVAFSVHDDDGRHASPNVLNGVQRFHRGSLTQKTTKMSVTAYIQGGGPEHERIRTSRSISTVGVPATNRCRS